MLEKMQLPSVMTILASIVSTSLAFWPSSANAFFRRAAAPATRALSSTKPPMPYDDDKMPFYALGTNLAVQVGGQGNFKTLLDDEELEIVLESFCDTLRGTATTDARTILTTYGPALNQILQERSSQFTERIKKEGEDFTTSFLDCNPEAIKLDSGLVYCEMKAGEGAQPTLKSNVEVHYHGTLTDGTVFDSSVERGQTISFPLGGVIKGWQEGLQMMKEGGKATLVIPSDLAYGDAGSGESKLLVINSPCFLLPETNFF